MEEVTNQVIKSNNEILLNELENYLEPLIKSCQLETEMSNDAKGPFQTGKGIVIGIMGEFIVKKIELISKSIKNPEKLEKSIKELKENCNSLKNLPNPQNMDVCNTAVLTTKLINSFKEKIYETIKLIKKSIEKFTKNNEIEDMKKELAELRLKVSNNQNNNTNFFNQSKEPNRNIVPTKKPDNNHNLSDNFF